MKKQICNMLRRLEIFFGDLADSYDEELHEELREALKDTSSYRLFSPTGIAPVNNTSNLANLSLSKCSHGIGWWDACDVCGRKIKYK